MDARLGGWVVGWLVGGRCVAWWVAPPLVQIAENADMAREKRAQERNDPDKNFFIIFRNPDRIRRVLFPGTLQALSPGFRACLGVVVKLRKALGDYTP